MRFQVRYPSGAEHEVELEGTVAVVGRDPSCDLVLNDAKCSRRHAVLEAGPQGIAIRDSGSANGVFVNGRKVERAGLTEGDVVQLGEVFLKVLSDEIETTLVMDEDEAANLAHSLPPHRESLDLPPPLPRVDEPGPPPLPPPQPSPPPPQPSPPALERTPQRPAPSPPASPLTAARPPLRAGPIPRPMTVTLLAALWGVGTLVYGAGGIIAWLALGEGLPGPPWLPALLGLAMAGVSAGMAVGMWLRSPWARVLQIVFAVFGLASCLFFPACLAIIIYMLRPEVRLQFRSRGHFRSLAPRDVETVLDDSADLTFAGAIIGSLLLGALLLLAATFFASGPIGALLETRTRTSEVAAISRLRTMVAAQSAFHTICSAGYGDVEGLVDPASTIPGYREDGPVFLSPDFREADHAGYRFELSVEEPLPPSPGCPERSFRRFSYAALPLTGEGRHFLVSSDGEIRAARGRPATPDDPPL